MLPPQAYYFPPKPDDPNSEALAERFARLPIFQPQLATSTISASYTSGVNWSDVGGSFDWDKDESWTSALFDLRALVSSTAPWRLLHTLGTMEIVTDLPSSPFASALVIATGLPAGRWTTQLQTNATFTLTNVLVQILVTECIPTPSFR